MQLEQQLNEKLTFADLIDGNDVNWKYNFLFYESIIYLT